MAVKHFILTGKDGYTAFLDPSIKIITPVDEAPFVQDILKSWFTNFGKTPEEILALPDKARSLLERRCRMLYTTIDNRDPSGKFIRVAPRLEDRMVNIGTPINHTD